ncbi:retrovirus-related pol polyprotein from transposon TNT 1-94 [Tanacetum coccineum]
MVVKRVYERIWDDCVAWFPVLNGKDPMTTFVHLLIDGSYDTTSSYDVHLYLALLSGYYVKKKHSGSYAYFVEFGNCLFSSSTKWVIDSGASDHMIDLKTKKIIVRGRKCDGLYVFEPKVSIFLVGLSSSSPFEAHCRLGYPSFQKPDAPPLKVYTRRPRITSDLVREPSSQPKDASIDAPNDAPNNVSSDVPISVSSEAYSDSDAPSDAPGGSDSPPPSPTLELNLPIALQKDLILVPKTVGEALAHFGWCAAMIKEMNALDRNDYAQTYGIGYSETFSPVAKISSTRLFISLTAIQDLALHQLDVKNAFLHGDLQEEVYMEQPPRFIASEKSRRVCKLKKALYGLKQSMRSWFGKFSNVVIKFGLRRSVYDLSVFYSSSNAGFIFLVVYVDDIVITGSDKDGIKKLKSFIGTCLQTKDLGSLKYFLGIKVSRSSKGVFGWEN